MKKMLEPLTPQEEELWKKVKSWVVNHFIDYRDTEDEDIRRNVELYQRTLDKLNGYVEYAKGIEVAMRT